MTEIYTAKTITGLEQLLADELFSLGARSIKTLNRAVEFEGNKEVLYKINFNSRFAINIIKPLFSFPMTKDSDLYKNIYAYDWSKLISADETFSIECTHPGSFFTNSLFVSQKTKDALVDRCRKEYLRRPSVDRKEPNFKIHVYFLKDHCYVGLNSSGEPLFKRGYRNFAVSSPLNEILAAALVELSGWKIHEALYNPMAGSGTIAIEAAMKGLRIPSGFFRHEFGFKKWKDYDKDLWREVRFASVEGILKKRIRIMASDLSFQAVKGAMTNIEEANLKPYIKIIKRDFFETTAASPSGTIIINPPYDVRMKEDDITDFYKRIGDTLKKGYADHTACILSGHMQALKHIGLKTRKKHVLYNGQIECRYNTYDLFEGSKY